ncbi:MAG TPA: phosphatidate cytidylyltransferase, partial [Propionibacteriaceae bacterium]|nr:phosphatidate cytidylyltransferase [Propionibacteriaceae bacterium]
MSEPPAAPAKTQGRAGRNLPAAIGIGVGLGAYVVLSLVYFKPAFVALVAVALVLAAVELHEALKKQGMTSAIIPISIGSVAIAFGS